MTPPTPNAAPPHARRKILINPPVFFISAAFILAFALFGALFPRRAGRLFETLQAEIVRDFGWLYIASVAAFLVFVIFLMASRYGDIKLGADDSEPEYSYLSWFAMLFSAGMGIGLLFFGVAEPIQHYSEPPVGQGGTIESARQAMVLTFFHWGLHAWAIYTVVGLALAYFAFRRGLPLTLRSALFPLIGSHIHGPVGHAIDIFAVLGTMFGVATSLGFGVLQVNAGFNHLFGLPVNPTVQLVLIAAITGMAALSTGTGLDRGVKRLSELNIILAIALLLFMLLAGSTVFLLQAFVQNIGAYLSALVDRTFRMYAYEPNAWLGEWTLFYWGWWISWSPFVGMFIARISRGRTVRQFVSGVLLVPALFTFLWMTAFGNTAIALDLNGAAPIARAVADNLPVALFVVLEQLPFPTLAAGLATLLVITFFVTSADSGALVIDMITSGAATHTPVWQRVFWSLCAGAVAAALLVAGGLQALQTAALVSALPFALVMLLIAYGLMRALQTEKAGKPMDLSLAADAPPTAELSWQQRLASIVHLHQREEVEAFLRDTVHSALSEVAAQLREGGLFPEITKSADQLNLDVPHGELALFRYTVRSRSFRVPSFAWVQADADAVDSRHYRAMAYSSVDEQSHDVTGYTRDQLIDDLLNRYASFRRARRLS